jgi:uncharacterized protein YkwD
MRNTLLFSVFLLFCLTAKAQALPALVPEDHFKSAWSSDMFDKFDWQKFFNYPPVNQEVDLKNIDYNLLNAAIFFVTNYHREKSNLSPLKYDEKLDAAASEHARDMVVHSFFSHESPVDGKKTIADRVKLAGLSKFLSLAENIAQNFAFDYAAGRGFFGGYNSAGVPDFKYSNGEKIKIHTYLSLAKTLLSQWLKSPGHRTNILDRQMTHLGTGAIFQKRENNDSFEKVFAVQAFAKLKE